MNGYININYKEIVKKGHLLLLNGNEFKILTIIGHYGDNKTKKAFPSIDMIEIRAGLGRKTICNALNRLEKMMYITKHRGKGRNNTYYLNEIPEFMEYLTKREILNKFESLRKYKKHCKEEVRVMRRLMGIKEDGRINNIKNLCHKRKKQNIKKGNTQNVNNENMGSSKNGTVSIT